MAIYCQYNPKQNNLLVLKKWKYVLGNRNKYFHRNFLKLTQL